MLPIAVLKPHDGQPVSSVTFLAAPHRPDHIILITGVNNLVLVFNESCSFLLNYANHLN